MAGSAPITRMGSASGPAGCCGTTRPTTSPWPCWGWASTPSGSRCGSSTPPSPPAEPSPSTQPGRLLAHARPGDPDEAQVVADMSLDGLIFGVEAGVRTVWLACRRAFDRAGRPRMKTDAHVIYRAQPIGSMPRPRHLKQAREDAAAGRLSPVELKRVEEGAVDDAIAAQEQAGLDVVTDGEARRGHFPGSLSG